MAKKHRNPATEVCVGCKRRIPFKEAQENAEWLEAEIGRPLEEGPICGICTRKTRFTRGSERSGRAQRDPVAGTRRSDPYHATRAHAPYTRQQGRNPRDPRSVALGVAPPGTECDAARCIEDADRIIVGDVLESKMAVSGRAQRIALCDDHYFEWFSGSRMLPLKEGRVLLAPSWSIESRWTR